MNSVFIVVAVAETGELVYVSNTSPILWDSSRDNAKHFYSYQTVKNELNDNFSSLAATIKYTNINTIFICEYINSIEVGREKFL